MIKCAIETVTLRLCPVCKCISERSGTFSFISVFQAKVLHRLYSAPDSAAHPAGTIKSSNPVKPQQCKVTGESINFPPDMWRVTIRSVCSSPCASKEKHYLTFPSLHPQTRPVCGEPGLVGSTTDTTTLQL